MKRICFILGFLLIVTNCFAVTYNTETILNNVYDSTNSGLKATISGNASFTNLTADVVTLTPAAGQKALTSISGDTTTTQLIIDGINRVGIGTNAPTALLDVRGRISGDEVVIGRLVGVYGNRIVTDANNIYNGIPGTTASKYWHVLDSAGTGRFSVNGTGNILIGGAASGTNAVANLNITNGTQPSNSIVNQTSFWSDDFAAGDSRIYLQSEAQTGTGNAMILGNSTIVGGNTAGGNLNLVSTTSGTLGQIVILGQISGDTVRLATRATSPDVTTVAGPALYFHNDGSLRLYNGSQWRSVQLN